MKKKRGVLITNLKMVTVGPIRVRESDVLTTWRGPLRTWCSALLLEENRDGDEVARRARGFGFCASVEVFDIELPSIDYTFELEPPPAWATEMGAALLSTHGKLTISSASGFDRWSESSSRTADIEMILDCESSDGRPIDFRRFDDITPQNVGHLWATLDAKIASYWSKPYIPTKRMVPADEHARATQGALG